MFRRNATYITPENTPTSNTCWRIFLPNDEAYKAALNELITYITSKEAWVEIDGISVELASELYTEQWVRLQEDACVIIGIIIPYMTASVPENCLACDGAVYNRVDYPDLYALLDTAFIIDADTFNVPDLRSRVAIGAGQGAGLSTYPVGDLGGEENHALTVSELASHGHIDAGHTHVEGSAGPNVTTIGAGVPQPTAIPIPSITAVGVAAIQNEGGGISHNNIQPYLALSYCVVAK